MLNIYPFVEVDLNELDFVQVDYGVLVKVLRDHEGKKDEVVDLYHLLILLRTLQKLEDLDLVAKKLQVVNEDYNVDYYEHKEVHIYFD